MPRTDGRRLGLGPMVVATLVLAIAMLGTVATHLHDRVEDRLGRIEGAFADLEDRPPLSPVDDQGRRPLTVLALGLDGENPSGRWQPGAQRSDTMMVVRVAADRSRVSVVSIPRDSWTAVPRHGRQKVNAAYSLGGPSLAVATVEQLTRVRIDHVAIVDLAGLTSITEALGSVTVDVAEDTVDTMRQRRWTTGRHQLDGGEAATYLRQRYGLPQGDFDRIRRQQHFLGQLLTGLREQATWRDPRGLVELVDLAAGHVSIDEEWPLVDVERLLWSLRDLTAADVHFVTAPVAGLGREAGQSVVRLDPAASRELWRALARGRVDQWARRHPDDRLDTEVR